MPIVPRNTISEPSGARLPEVGMAKPRIAEAMGAVAGALGGRASSIGRLASTTGSMIDALDRQYRQKSEIDGAKYKGEMAKWNGVGEVAGNLVQGAANGVKIASAIYERKSQQQADNALTEYTEYLTGTTTGYQDAKSGQRVPGTLEAPYSTGNEKDEATGPSIATAKAVKEWMEREDGTYAKLSPMAKREFDQRAARITQSVMDRAMRAEYDQMQAFRQANNKAAFDADRKHVASLGVDVSPAGNEQWMIDTMAARDAQVMREIGRYQKDPSNGSLDRAKWSSPDVERYAAQAAEQILETFAADRVDILLASARNEPDDAKREALLATAAGTAEMEYRGSPVLSPLARMKATSDILGVRSDVQKSKAERYTALNALASDQLDGVMVGLVERKDLMQTVSMLPPERSSAILKKLIAFDQEEEQGRFDEMLAHAQNTGDMDDMMAASSFASGMSDAKAREENLLKVKNAGATAQKEQDADVHSATLTQYDLVALSPKVPDETGRMVDATPERRMTLLRGGLKNHDLTWSEYQERKAIVAKSAGAPQDLLLQGIHHIEEKLGVEILDDGFSYAGDRVQFAEMTRTVKGKTAPYHPYAPNTAFGKDPFGPNNATGLRVEGKDRTRRVALSAALVRDVLQSAIEWQTSLKGQGVKEDPRTFNQFIDDLLDFSGPKALPSAKAFTEDLVRRRMADEIDTTRRLVDYYEQQEWQSQQAK